MDTHKGGRFWPTLIIAALLLISSPSPAPTSAQTARPGATWGDGSLMFVENVGQFHPQARFQVYSSGAVLWLAEDALWLVKSPPPSPLSPDGRGERGWGEGFALRLSFPGSNRHPRLEPFDRRDTVFNYYLGNDPARWRTHVPVWGGVRYIDLFPGIDLEVSGQNGQPAWRMVCRQADCGADLQNIRLRVAGASRVELVGSAIHVATASGKLTLPLLQVISLDGTPLQSPPPASEGLEISAPFSRTTALTASSQDNPHGLLYSTLLGGDKDDCPYGSCAIAVDSDGNAYVTGMTESWDFPTTPGAFDTSYPVLGDAFVAKLKPDGDGLAYATLLGGGKEDEGRAIVVDRAGHVYVTGVTASDNFPTTSGAYDESYNAGYYPDDAFVVKLNSDGSGLVYATYLGGTANDRATGIALDGANNVYVTGSTQSSDFPTTQGAFDPIYNPPSPQGELDAFVTKLNANGTELVYSTYLGGGADDGGQAIAVDDSGNAYVTGSTQSGDFPTTPEAFDSGQNGAGDAFVTKLNAAGSALAYSTFLGGSEYDSGTAIVVDAAGNAYVQGSTFSSAFPTTPGAFDDSFGGGVCGSGSCSDVFVLKMDPTGAHLVYATFLGDDDQEYAGNAMAIDSAGRAYVTGGTRSAGFPTTASAFDSTYNGGYGDAFVVELNSTGSGLDYATFLGGSGIDFGYALALGDTDQVYVAGHTQSSDFPTTAGAFDTTHSGGYDAFVSKISTLPPAPDLSQSSKRVSPDTAVVGQVVTFTLRMVNSGALTATVSCTDTLPAELQLHGAPVASVGTPVVNGQTITWAEEIPVGTTVTITYATELTSTTTLTPTTCNEAHINDGAGQVYRRRAYVNGYHIYLPLVRRDP
ncbi:MAG: hypothetical protein DRI77_05285 [Chloroflexi bacterium]|nr:MAG: hypothetical protein DRI77_05285 [Chloroflexota bacterium]